MLYNYWQRVYELTNLFRSRRGVFAKNGRSGDNRSRDLAGQLMTDRVTRGHINHSRVNKTPRVELRARLNQGLGGNCFAKGEIVKAGGVRGGGA